MLQRWALNLSAYSYDIVHRPGKKIAQADFMSRNSHQGTPEENGNEAFLINPKKTTNIISTPDATDLVVRQTIKSIFHKGSHFIDEITQQDLEPHVTSLAAAVCKRMKGKKNAFDLNDLNQICKTLEDQLSIM